MKWIAIGILTIVMIGCSTINEELEMSNCFCPKCESNSFPFESKANRYARTILPFMALLLGCVLSI